MLYLLASLLMTHINMVDIAWTMVVVAWTLMAITFSITKVKVFRCGGGIYTFKTNPIQSKEKWLIRVLVLMYLALVFYIARRFAIPWFDDFADISKPFFVKIGFTIFIIAIVIFMKARIAISSNWTWSKVQQSDRTKLIKLPPYNKVRHPQYGAYLLAILATGLMLVKSSLIMFGLLLIPMVYLKMKIEEECLKSVFPKEYTEYIEKTRMMF